MNFQERNPCHSPTWFRPSSKNRMQVAKIELSIKQSSAFSFSQAFSESKNPRRCSSQPVLLLETSFACCAKGTAEKRKFAAILTLSMFNSFVFRPEKLSIPRLNCGGKNDRTQVTCKEKERTICGRFGSQLGPSFNFKQLILVEVFSLLVRFHFL